MNLGTFKLGVIMAAVFAVGVSGTYFGIQQTSEYTANLSNTAAGFISGHVTATVVGPDGEIKAYRQTDNAIVEGGMELIASQVFKGINYTSERNGFIRHLADLGSSPVDAIGIGTNVTAVALSDDYTIQFNAACLNQTVDWDIGLINATDATGRAYSLNGGALIGINGSATFGPSPACGGGTTYTEAGAFDTTRSFSMFATNTFNSVTLGNPDSLIINWNFQFNDS